MTEANKHREKFQKLLRELFQFDCADLDFGIYRIINHKRDAIEKFISTDLPKSIADELDRGILAGQSDASGNSPPPPPRGSSSHGALEDTLFNHLYAFFSRYYQEGDFISKRRYSRRARYAIPYNGEEVYLHWANSDQYYIKTGEYFRDYTFISNGITVHFKLTSADVEQNNVQGDKRFFVPVLDEIEWREKADELAVPFEFRPLTNSEKGDYGKSKHQDKIIAKAMVDIPKRLEKVHKPLGAITSERHKDSDGKPVTFLEYHVRQYTRRNTSDFFIHKDLKGFLSRELDFYLKSEVLNLDEMEAAGEDRADGWFRMMRTIKLVGGRIIDFLDQIENFQKMLWEKRKFVTETQYCITVGNIDERFYPDIAACKAQWKEWNELFHIHEFSGGLKTKKDRIDFLKAYPTLVLDTKYFDLGFTDMLLERIDDLDNHIDGVLIHSENWQMLNLFSKKYHDEIKCIYIDPPYNTDMSPILYKNNYRHSSWMSLVAEGISTSKRYLTKDGVLSVAVDDEEVYNLKLLIDAVVGADRYAGTVVIQSNPGGRDINTHLATSHDYCLFYVNPGQTEMFLPRENVENEYKTEPFRRTGGLSTPQDRENSEFAFYYDPIGLKILGVGGKRTKSYPAEYQPTVIYCLDSQSNVISMTPRDFFSENSQMDIIMPIFSNGDRGVWRWSNREKILSAVVQGNLFVKENSRTVMIRSLVSEMYKPKTVWTNSSYSSSAHGTIVLQNIMGEKNVFSYPKSVHTVTDVIQAATYQRSNTLVLDYFAGSGTTGHSVINLNRKDDSGRKFILAEIEHYFDTVLLPRIKKVTFSPEWKDGKPKCAATKEEIERSPRIVKYLRLESYEDSLNNIAFDHTAGQKAMKFDDYLLKYMLKWETKRSETLLNVEKLNKPFDYSLYTHGNGQTEERLADVPETFNYLLGLRVRTRQVHDDDGRRYLVYRGEIDRRQVSVIWRDTEGWLQDDFERDKKFVTDQGLTKGAAEVFVNGDSFIPGAKPLEPVFKARMFAPVES